MAKAKKLLINDFNVELILTKDEASVLKSIIYDFCCDNILDTVYDALRTIPGLELKDGFRASDKGIYKCPVSKSRTR